MEPVPRLWAVPSVPRLDELSRLQHGSSWGLLAAECCWCPSLAAVRS